MRGVIAIHVEKIGACNRDIVAFTKLGGKNNTFIGSVQSWRECRSLRSVS